jgi:hypothetical protein
MATLAQASLSTDERALLTRFAAELYSEDDVQPRAIWLFGSRARGEQPEEYSDVDVLVLVEDASWEGKMRVMLLSRPRRVRCTCRRSPSRSRSTSTRRHGSSSAAEFAHSSSLRSIATRSRSSTLVIAAASRCEFDGRVEI